MVNPLALDVFGDDCAWLTHVVEYRGAIVVHWLAPSDARRGEKPNEALHDLAFPEPVVKAHVEFEGGTAPPMKERPPGPRSNSIGSWSFFRNMHLGPYVLVVTRADGSDVARLPLPAPTSTTWR